MKAKVLSKFDLAVIVAAIAGGALWTEHGHRIAIDAPTLPEFASPAPACPDNDNMPYSAKCLVYLQGGDASEVHSQANPVTRAPAASAYVTRYVDLNAPVRSAACPDNDNLPYSASCLKFLSGWLWQPETASMAAPAVYAPR